MIPELYITLALAFAVAAITAFSLTPLVKILAAKVGAIDIPKDARRMHKTPIPRLGGLAIFCGFIFSALLFGEHTDGNRAVLLGACLIVVLGIMDDIMQLNAKPKFIVQTIAALIPVLSGVRIDVLTNFNIFSDDPYIILGPWSIPITLLWIVGMINAVNFIDGLDGLAVGVSSIGTISLMTISIFVSDISVALTAAALAGACIGFIPYNINPAKIFMGDTGAMFLGYMMATMSIQGLFKLYAVISFAVPFLIFGLVIFDTAFAILRRILTGRSPMQADRGHLHHRLIDMGFSQKQAVAIMYVVSAILGLAAVLLTSDGIMKALLLIAAAMVISLVAARMVDENRKRMEDAKAAEQDSAGHEEADQGSIDQEENTQDTEEPSEQTLTGAYEPPIADSALTGAPPVTTEDDALYDN